MSHDVLALESGLHRTFRVNGKAGLRQLSLPKAVSSGTVLQVAPSRIDVRRPFPFSSFGADAIEASATRVPSNELGTLPRRADLGKANLVSERSPGIQNTSCPSSTIPTSGSAPHPDASSLANDVTRREVFFGGRRA